MPLPGLTSRSRRRDLSLQPGDIQIIARAWSASREETMKTLMMTAAVLAGIVINVANAAPLPEAKPDDVGFSQQGLTRLDEFFAREIAAKRVPGAVVAIARDGKPLPYKAYRHLHPTAA